MPEQAVNKSAEALVICLAPDVCLTPMGSSMVPVPYTITCRFNVAEHAAPKVNYCGLPAFTMASRLPRVEGDEQGTGGGIISHVNGGYCRPVEHSGTVRAHGAYIVRHGDLMHMNCNGPDGPANTYGRIVYVGVGAAGEVSVETLQKDQQVTVDPRTGKTVVEERTLTRNPKTGEVTETRQRTVIDPKTGALQTEREAITTGADGTSSYEAAEGSFDPAEQRFRWETTTDAGPGTTGALDIADDDAELLADADYQAAQQEQAATQAEIDAAHRELAWEAAKAGVDLAGIVDPTPISDTVGGVMALSEGDFLGAGLSMVSWIPWLGDAVAKPLKEGRAAAKIAKLSEKVNRLKGKMKKLADLAEKAKQRAKDLLKKKRGGGGDAPTPKKPPNPGDGGHIPPQKKPSKAQMKEEQKNSRIDEYLQKEGRKVDPNPKEGVPGEGRQGDRYIDGTKAEYKTLDPGATSSTIKNTVNNSIRKEGQARQIIIDARDSGLTMQEAQKGIQRAMDISRGKVDSVRIIGDGFDITN